MEQLSEEALHHVSYNDLMTQMVGGINLACESFLNMLDVLKESTVSGKKELHAIFNEKWKEWKRLKTQLVVLQNQIRRESSTVTRIQEKTEIDLPCLSPPQQARRMTVLSRNCLTNFQNLHKVGRRRLRMRSRNNNDNCPSENASCFDNFHIPSHSRRFWRLRTRWFT